MQKVMLSKNKNKKSTILNFKALKKQSVFHPITYGVTPKSVRHITNTECQEA